MRIESSVTAITWIPSEAIEGRAKVLYTLGLRAYDVSPPDAIDDLDRVAKRHAFRLANELRGWIDVQRGTIVGYGFDGRALNGETRVRLGPKQLAFPAASLPLVQAKPEVGRGWVRFAQTAAVRLGVPAATAWTTVQLVVYTTGQSRGALLRASGFPRHWVYDAGRLIEKSGAITLDPAAADVAPVVAAAESELERSLAESVLGGGGAIERRRVAPGETLVRQGEPGDELFVVVDGVLDVEIDGAVVAQVGPGAVLGERAVLEGGERTATLRAVTACRVAVLAGDQISRYELQELAATRRDEGDEAT